jgi:hypothetical protein
VIRTDEVDERFGRINTRLKIKSPVNERIIAAASHLIDVENRTLTAQETLFTLNRCCEQEKAVKLKEKVLSNFNKDAAYSFFSERRLFPSDTAGWMPADIRLKVSESLFATEDNAKSIPDHFKKEAALSPSYAKEDLKNLLDVAVNRSATFVRGLMHWQTLFKDQLIGPDVQQAVQTKALHRVQIDQPESIADYLLLADDAGGDRLAVIKPGFKQGDMLTGLVNIIKEQISNGSDTDLKAKSKDWLRQLAESELRLRLDLDQKDDIAFRVPQHWENYARMRQAFLGDAPTGTKSKPPDERERGFLAQELAQAVAASSSSSAEFIPDLDELYELLRPDYVGTVVNSLLDFEPVLTAGDSTNWIYGWLKLSKLKSEDEDQRARCLAKHRRELIRLMVQTNVPLRKSEKLDELEHENFIDLFRALLAEGGDEADGPCRHRLLGIFQRTYPSDRVKDAFRDAYSETSSDKDQREILSRRFVGHNAVVTAIENRLGKDQKREFNQLINKKTTQETELAKNRILDIFSSGKPEPAPYDEILQVEKLAQAAGEDVFKNALSSAFAQLSKDAELTNSFLTGGAASKACFTFYKNVLPAQEGLIEKLERYKQRLDSIALMTKCISEGDEGHDKDYKTKLFKILRDDKVDQHTLNAFNDAFARALESDATSEILIRRYLPVVPSSRPRDNSPEILKDRDFDFLFKTLTPEISHAFLKKLWKFSEDKGYPENLLIKPMRQAFANVRQVYDQKRSERNRNPPSEPFLDEFPKSLMRFLGESPGLKKQIGLWELGSDRAVSIDKYLQRYFKYIKYKSNPDEEDPIVANEPTETNAKEATGFWQAFKDVFGSKN